MRHAMHLLIIKDGLISFTQLMTVSIVIFEGAVSIVKGSLDLADLLVFLVKSQVSHFLVRVLTPCITSYPTAFFSSSLILIKTLCIQVNCDFFCCSLSQHREN